TLFSNSTDMPFPRPISDVIEPIGPVDDIISSPCRVIGGLLLIFIGVGVPYPYLTPSLKPSNIRHTARELVGSQGLNAKEDLIRPGKVLKANVREGLPEDGVVVLFRGAFFADTPASHIIFTGLAAMDPVNQSKAIFFI